VSGCPPAGCSTPLANQSSKAALGCGVTELTLVIAHQLLGEVVVAVEHVDIVRF
jgi:hypothetical protein